MKHPILNQTALKYYVLVWVVIFLIHSSILYLVQGSPLVISLADGLTYNALFALLAIGLWYVVTFASLNKDELGLIGMHAGAALITLVVWYHASDFILKLTFKNPDYNQFLEEASIIRVIIGLMYYCITCLIFYLMRYYQERQDRVKHELELQTLLKDAELRMLKSQINPHFIFNSLNSINALTITKPASAQEMVVKLSEFLRYSLGKESAEMNTLAEEIKNVSLYLEIEKVRFGDRLQFEQKVSKECLSVKVPNLILQPLVENAIKYGIYDTLDPVAIQLHGEQVDESLEVSILNSYDPDAVKSKGEGIGLKNIQKRMNLVYGRSGLVRIRQNGNEFCVTLTMPINQSEG